MGCSFSKTNAIALAGADLPKVKLASIDVDSKEVHSILRKHEGTGALGSFFTEIMDEESKHEMYAAPNFIVKTHVTMAYAGSDEKKSEQMITKFRDLEGKKVSMAVTGFLWSSTNAAFSVEISHYTLEGVHDVVPVPCCENVFEHITVWCSEPSSGKSWSNRLPQQVKAGEATRIDFPRGDELIGEFSFWDQSNNPVLLRGAP